MGPTGGTSLLPPPNVNPMPTDLGVSPTVSKAETLVTSQCPEFYAKNSLILSRVIYLGLLWLGLIILLNPSVSFGSFTKQYLKLPWWLIINSMWIWVVINHHLETASYYPEVSVTPRESPLNPYPGWSRDAYMSWRNHPWVLVLPFSGLNRGQP
ncbi:hypothetical protein DSO57_1007776 [Entomophthora muscae]|uniref:Uncharacterized protein n=1 Tax=Entomophthora muscae TaxID=34485 RepID=A0ACC2UUC6_9FUNG|nr:hypothetical protein DSO57_1007776 [Entomophthora muscae]